MLFYHDPKNLFNAVFNMPQGATMTLAMSLYLGALEPVGFVRTFVCAYCAGVMLTAFLRVPEFGAWVGDRLHCPKSGPLRYLAENLSGGGLMGILMNFFITFMNMGPVPEFPMAYLATLPFAVVVSAVSSSLWVGLSQRIVAHAFPKPE